MTRVASFARPANTFKHPINTNTPAMIQSSVQQPQVQGRLYTLTQQDARASNAMVEGKVYLEGNTIVVLFDPGTIHF